MRFNFLVFSLPTSASLFTIAQCTLVFWSFLSILHISILVLVETPFADAQLISCYYFQLAALIQGAEHSIKKKTCSSDLQTFANLYLNEHLL